ncbi:hypothetical protein [Phyllobacterium sp. OV277]|uniref:hypothetical protein n=1 Tax=Phyllobacterium sp. OV277 TaxID=1882772 RepID=UPI00087EED55|nr:hypothetical protein [Phyllobacterium sp. OV277]SDP05846.1 hypothetical protein SAMN05443582_103286 [Phyllobacterium sp. OV277]
MALPLTKPVSSARPLARVFVCVLGIGLLISSSAMAEVRLGKNVRIFGHDFSHRTYKRVEIETTHKRPPWYGCRIFKKGSVYQGRTIRERTEICNLKPVARGKRR